MASLIGHAIRYGLDKRKEKKEDQDREKMGIISKEDEINALLQKIEYNPNNHFLHMELGMLYFQYHNTERAVYYMKRCIEINPTFEVGYHNFGAILASIGRIEEAQSCFLKTIELHDCADTHGNYGLILVNINKYEEALSEFLKAVEMDPESEETLSNLHFHYIRMEKWVEAENVARKLVSKNQNNAQVYTLLSYSLLHQKRFQEAETEINLSLNINPHYDKALLLKTLLEQKKKDGEYMAEETHQPELSQPVSEAAPIQQHEFNPPQPIKNEIRINKHLPVTVICQVGIIQKSTISERDLYKHNNKWLEGTFVIPFSLTAFLIFTEDGIVAKSMPERRERTTEIIGIPVHTSTKEIESTVLLNLKYPEIIRYGKMNQNVKKGDFCTFAFETQKMFCVIYPTDHRALDVGQNGPLFMAIFSLYYDIGLTPRESWGKVYFNIPFAEFYNSLLKDISHNQEMESENMTR